MDTTVLPHAPALIAGYIRAAASRRPGGRIGPFTVGLDPHSDVARYFREYFVGSYFLADPCHSQKGTQRARD